MREDDTNKYHNSTDLPLEAQEGSKSFVTCILKAFKLIRKYCKIPSLIQISRRNVKIFRFKLAFVLLRDSR